MLRLHDFLISLTAEHVKLTSDSVVHSGVSFSVHARPQRQQAARDNNEIQLTRQFYANVEKNRRGISRW